MAFQIPAFIKAIFMAPKAAETSLEIAKEASSGIMAAADKMFYTAEEKADDQKALSQEGFSAIKKLWDTFQNDNSARSVARRQIAYVLIYLYAGVIVIGMFLISISGCPPLEMLELMISFLCAMYFPHFVGSVMFTYFIPYQIGKAIVTAKNGGK